MARTDTVWALIVLFHPGVWSPSQAALGTRPSALFEFSHSLQKRCDLQLILLLVMDECRLLKYTVTCFLITLIFFFLLLPVIIEHNGKPVGILKMSAAFLVPQFGEGGVFHCGHGYVQLRL